MTCKTQRVRVRLAGYLQHCMLYRRPGSYFSQFPSRQSEPVSPSSTGYQPCCHRTKKAAATNGKVALSWPGRWRLDHSHSTPEICAALGISRAPLSRSVEEARISRVMTKKSAVSSQSLQMAANWCGSATYQRGVDPVVIYTFFC
jgi:hypothetical protein